LTGRNSLSTLQPIPFKVFRLLRAEKFTNLSIHMIQQSATTASILPAL
jgi:hypothetical protein